MPTKKHNITTRSIAFKDVNFVYQLLSDESIAKYNNYPYPPTRNHVLNYIQHDLELKYAKRGERLVIIANTTPIGTFCYRRYYRGIELSFELLAQYQGNGIIKQVYETLMPGICKQYQPVRLVAKTNCENFHCIKLLKALNFVQYKHTSNTLFFEKPLLTG